MLRRILRTALQLFFHLLYRPFAWSYDFVAWVVSGGQWQNWTASALPYVHGPQVLELGFGPGHLQIRLRQVGLIAFGLDASPNMVAQAGRRLQQAGLRDAAGGLVRGLAEALPFPTASFDTVLSTFPSEYIARSQTLAEIRRVLRADGVLVVVPAAWITGRSLFERLGAALFRLTGQGGKLSDWQGAFCTWLEQGGFDCQVEIIELPASRLIVISAHKKIKLE